MVEKGRKKITVLGSKGMLGTDVVAELRKNSFSVLAYDKDDLDITKSEEVISFFRKDCPDIVINCAAYTNVEGSEAQREEALLLNATAVKIIAEACKGIDAILVHYSTDYVFDGKEKKGYTEEGKRNQINHYGYTKALGEKYLEEVWEKHYLIRTSWLFGENGKNFIEAMKKKANEKEVRVVNDQHGCPTYTKDLAKATIELITQKYPFGTYHLTNSGACTWHEFAKEIMKQLRSEAKVISIKTSELNLAAKRPSCSILLNTKFKSALPSWKDAVRRYLGYP